MSHLSKHKIVRTNKSNDTKFKKKIANIDNFWFTGS